MASRRASRGGGAGASGAGAGGRRRASHGARETLRRLSPFGQRDAIRARRNSTASAQRRASAGAATAPRRRLSPFGSRASRRRSSPFGRARRGSSNNKVYASQGAQRDAADEERIVREAQSRIRRHRAQNRGLQSRTTSFWRRALCGAHIEMTQITGEIFLGDMDDAQNLRLLADAGVTHVLNCAAQCPDYHREHFVYHSLELYDDRQAPASAHFHACSRFLARVEQLGGRALVHCVAGVSRSATMIVAHLMIAHRLSLARALHTLRSRRPVVLPNQGFLLQLAELEVELRGGSSVVRSPDRIWDFHDFHAVKHRIRPLS